MSDVLFQRNIEFSKSTKLYFVEYFQFSIGTNVKRCKAGIIIFLIPFQMWEIPMHVIILFSQGIYASHTVHVLNMQTEMNE